MHPKLVGLHQLKNELEGKNMDSTFVTQLLNEALWKNQNRNVRGFEVRAYREDGDYYEVVYLEGGDEADYFECNENGEIFVHQLYSQSLTDWRPVDDLKADKELYPNRYRQLQEKLAQEIEKYNSQEPCKMDEIKERKVGAL